MQVECLKDWPGIGGWEALFYKYHVNVVINGHVHSCAFGMQEMSTLCQ